MMKNKKLFYGIFVVCVLAITGIGLFILKNPERIRMAPQVGMSKEASLAELKAAEDEVKIAEERFGPDHPNVVDPIHKLAQLYDFRGRTAEGEVLLKRAVSIRENALGLDHPDVAQSLDFLANFYATHSNYSEAEALYRRSLDVKEKGLGPTHSDLLSTLNNLAFLYVEQGRYTEAEPLRVRELSIMEKTYGPNDSAVLLHIDQLALLYDLQGKYTEADSLYQRSLAIRREIPDSQFTLLKGTFKPPYCTTKALEIREEVFGPDHPAVATVLDNMAESYRIHGIKSEAKKFKERSERIRLGNR